MPKQDNTYEKKIMLMRRKMTRLGAMLLFLAAALSSCTRELPYGAADSPLNDKDIHMVPLWIEGQGGDTKVAVNDGSGKCSWLKGDAIAMYITGSGANTYSNLTVDHTENCVRVGLPGNQEIGFYSIYPAGARVDSHYGNTELRVKYGNEYMLPKMGADSLNLWSPLPMVAANTENGSALNSISFYHVGGLLRLVLTNYSKSDVTAIRVTLEGMKKVTGVFTVNNPATLAADVTFQSGVDSDQNVITYTIPSGHNSKLPDELWINVPLPTGDYTTLSGVKVDAVSASAPRSITRKVQWSKIRHGQGKHIQMDLSGAAGALSYVAVGSTDDVTLWAGETLVRRAIAYDAADIAIPSAAITWASSNPSVAQVQNNGTLTAMAAGTTLITATATAGGVTKTESFTLHVNEITGITLDRRTLYARKGASSSLTATVQYTTNGTVPEVPKVNWSSSVPAKATLSRSRTTSGERNAINPLALGATVITASVPANSYGTNPLRSVTANLTVIGAKYIPGAFSVSPTKQVFFASGNLQINYTNENGNHKREWLFSDNQWNIYLDDIPSSPVPGTTYRISHFGWATAGVKNPGGDYGYDSGQKYFYPEQRVYQLTPGNQNNMYGYGPSSNGTSSWASSLPFGIVEGNTWNADPNVAKYCEWGVHFDDEGYGSDTFTNGSWFTPSVFEWNYLLNVRPRAFLLSAPASIFIPELENYVQGLVILPDNFEDCPEGCSFAPHYESYSTNMYSLGDKSKGPSGEWSKMEEYGAVFLVSAGWYRPDNLGYYDEYDNWIDRYGFNYETWGIGFYWSSSMGTSRSQSHFLYSGPFNRWTITDSYPGEQTNGLRSVRLVHE